MKPRPRPKSKLLGFTLLGLSLLAPILALYFVTQDRERDASSAASSSVVKARSAEADPPGRPDSPGVRGEPGLADGPTEQPSIETSQPEDLAAVQPPSQLQEAELEHLEDVFLNSVYPSFQYDFQLNREGRSAIDVFVASMPEDLGEEDLNILSAMITDRLSGREGEDLAFIITHLYRLEQEEARLMNDGAPITSMADQLEAQEKLSQLRERWFGPELSEVLFSVADEDETLPGENTAASEPEGGGDEEAAENWTEEQVELAESEQAWERRYQKFNAEKQIIDNAGLDQAEKDRQIEALLQQHYSPQELEAARAFDRQQTSPQ